MTITIDWCEERQRPDVGSAEERMAESDYDWVSSGIVIPHLDKPLGSCVACRKGGILDELHIYGLSRLDEEMLKDVQGWIREELGKK